VSGEGVTAALLRSRGIRVFSEDELEAADSAIREIERQLPTTQPPTTQGDRSQ
jgi:hypothetical protein